MGIVFRQSVKSTIIIFLGAVLGALLIYMSTRILEKSEFGYTRDMIALGAITLPIISLGFNNAIGTLTNKYPHTDDRRRVLFTLGAIMPLIVTTLLSIPYFILRDKIIDLYQPQDRDLANKYFIFLPILILIWSYMSLFESYLLSQIKAAISSFAKEVVLRVANIALLVLVYFKVINFHDFIIGLVLAHCLPTLLMFWASRNLDGFGGSLNFKAFTKKEYQEVLHFSWYHLLLGISMGMIIFLNTLMLGRIDKSGLTSLAEYSTAIYILSIMSMPYRAMSISSFTTLNNAYIENNLPKLANLFYRSSITILIVGVAMFALIFCNMDNAIALLPKGYEEVKTIVNILIVGALIDMSTGLNNEVISISKYYKFNFRLSILVIVLMVCLNLVLIPKYSMQGAAWSYTLSIAVFNIAKMIFLNAKMQLRPFSVKSAYVFAAGIPAAIAGYFMPHLGSPFIDAPVRSLVIIIIYLALLIWWKPSEDLSTYLASITKNKRLF